MVGHYQQRSARRNGRRRPTERGQSQTWPFHARIYTVAAQHCQGRTTQAPLGKVPVERNQRARKYGGGETQERASGASHQWSAVADRDLDHLPQRDLGHLTAVSAHRSPTGRKFVALWRYPLLLS